MGWPWYGPWPKGCDATPPPDATANIPAPHSHGGAVVVATSASPYPYLSLVRLRPRPIFVFSSRHPSHTSTASPTASPQPPSRRRCTETPAAASLLLLVLLRGSLVPSPAWRRLFQQTSLARSFCNHAYTQDPAGSLLPSTPTFRPPALLSPPHAWKSWLRGPDVTNTPATNIPCCIDLVGSGARTTRRDSRSSPCRTTGRDLVGRPPFPSPPSAEAIRGERVRPQRH